jgi:glycosyltransferase involved in cell wall biosynthesis
MREKISACIITFNEERRIRRCLESVRWCDEIVIMDSYSTDHTLDVCREFTDRVYQHEWLGYVGQRNLIREKATHPWVLFLDSDEEVSPGLKQEILTEFDYGNSTYVGYEFPRQVYYIGKWIRHGEWYPDIKLRLFKKQFGRTEGQEPHDQVKVNGPVKRLTRPIWHYTHNDIRDHLDTLNRFSSITAQQRFSVESWFPWWNLLFRPFLRFFKGYFLKGGILDGSHGFIIAVINSFGAFAKYAKLWELSQKHKPNYKELPEV